MEEGRESEDVALVGQHEASGSSDDIGKSQAKTTARDKSMWGAAK